MPNVYLRVPHYVASYFRNKNRANRIEVGGIIKIDPSDPIYAILVEKLSCNSTSINKGFCFCSRQWKRMMQGFPPVSKRLRQKPILTQFADELTLNDDEIFTLTGLRLPKNSDKGEYLCIAIPKEIAKDGSIVTTNDYWKFSEKGANAVRQAMVDEFWRALYVYMDTRREVCANTKGRKFVVIEGLESFMERYDIRNSTEDQHELQTLKRGMNRKRYAFRFTEEDYIEHG